MTAPRPADHLTEFAAEKISDLVLAYLGCLDEATTVEEARERFWRAHGRIDREYGDAAQRYLEERMADLEFCCGCIRLEKSQPENDVSARR